MSFFRARAVAAHPSAPGAVLNEGKDFPIRRSVFPRRIGEIRRLRSGMDAAILPSPLPDLPWQVTHAVAAFAGGDGSQVWP